jgi:hypothetical protein
MLLGEVFQSIRAWQKLASVNMKPMLAYKIFKYVKLVNAEYEIAEKQRVALIRELTGIKEGDAKLEPNTPEAAAYVEKFNEILQTESDLQQLDMDFEEVVNAVDEKNESLTMNDLAMLEPFFLSSEVDSPDESELLSCGCTRYADLGK